MEGLGMKGLTKNLLTPRPLRSEGGGRRNSKCGNWNFELGEGRER